MNWGSCRVFVTGATGMVGSWLVKRLIGEGAYIVTLIRDWDPQSELIRSGDINRTNVISGCLEDYQVVERAITSHEVDTVFHLGAQTIVGTAQRSPLATFEANIRGTYHLLDVCRLHKDMVRRIVLASSDKAYGSAKSLPYTEDMPLNGRNPYDVSKSCADLIATAYALTYGVPVAVARCGNIYGGGDLNWSRIVPGTIRSFFEEQRPVLRSNGQYTREYIFVNDVVEGYLLLAAKSSEPGYQGEGFNFSNESSLTVLQITRKIQQLMNRLDLEPVILDQAEGEIHDQQLDSTKAKRLLNWSPAYKLEDGLMATIRWYREFFSFHKDFLGSV